MTLRIVTDGPISRRMAGMSERGQAGPDDRPEETPVDFFIAHASEDTDYAERLYALLEPRSRPFLDSRSLFPGQLWRDQLEAALGRARITVALLSRHTEEAFYQKVEIAEAIDRATEGSHLVVPVFLDGQAPQLYGLRLFEGIKAGSGMSVEDVAERLLGMLGGAWTGARQEYRQARPYERLTRGVTTALMQLDGFLRAYLGTADNPEPFEGRAAVLAQLDAWHAQDQSFALVTAPAGRGKSALLTRWAMNIAERGEVDVVFVPISLGFQTTQPMDVLGLLGERLAWVVSGVEESEPPDTVPGWRRRITRILTDLTGGRQRPLLIVVDGMDEMAGWHDERLPLPLVPNPGVKVLVGARLLADRNAVGWRDWLNWPGEATVSIGLAPLDEPSIGALVRDRLPTVPAGTAAAISHRLTVLTEGDALTLRLYLDDLRERSMRGAEVTAASLNAEVPGLAGYFKRWWAEQERQWEADGENPIGESADAEAILGLCAAAFGPLLEGEISALVRGRVAQSLYLRRKLHELTRLLVTIETPRGSGYSLAHPRLAIYFDGAARHWRDPLIAYCRRGREAIENGADAREWNYVVHHYAAHLQANRQLQDDWQALVTPAWRDAWLALEGSDERFLADLAQAWQAADQMMADGSPALAVGAQLGCAMASASIHGIANAISERLMLALVREGEWSAEKTFDRARRVAILPRRVRALVEIAPYLTDRDLGRGAQDLLIAQDAAEGLRGVPALARRLPPGAARPILDEVIRHAATVDDGWDRGVILAECVRGLAIIGDHAAALQLARSVDTAWAKPLCLVECLAADDTATAAMLAEVEAAAEELPVESGYWAAWALAGLAAASPDGDAVRLLNLAASRGRVLEDPRHARRVTIGVALRAHRMGFAVAGEIWATAKALPKWVMGEMATENNAKEWLTDWGDSEWGATAELVSSRPSPAREEALGRMIDDLLALDGRGWHTALVSMVPWLHGLPSGTLQRVLDALAEQRNRFERGEALAALSAVLPRDQRRPVLRTALAPLEVIQDEGKRAVVLASLAEQMGDTERRRWAARAVAVARGPRDHLSAQSPVAVAAALDDDEILRLLAEALASDPSATRQVAQAYARRGFLSEAVNAQAKLGTNEELVVQLAAVAPSLDPAHLRWTTVAADVLTGPARGQVIVAPIVELREASRLGEARALARLLARHYGVHTVASWVPAELGSELTDLAVDQVREARDLIGIVRIFPYLPADELAAARQRVIDMVTADLRTFSSSEQDERFWEFIPEDFAAEIARSAEAIENPRQQGRVLASVLPRLDGGLRTHAIQTARAALEMVKPDFVRVAETAGFVAALGADIDFAELQSVTAAVCDLEFIREAPLRDVTSAALQLSDSQLARWWNALVPRLARRPREGLLEDLMTLIPVIARLAGEPGLVQAAQAIEGASRWFAALAADAAGAG